MGDRMEALETQFTALRKQYLDSRFSALNEVQRRAVFTTEGPLLILAGAGSGKTTVLVNRIANLILYGGAYHAEVLAADVSPPLLQELEGCLQTGAAPSPALARLLAVNPVAPWNILAITFTNKAAGELKARLSARLGEELGGSVNASTFHSGCVRILRQHAECLGFPKSFTIYDSDDQQRVLKEIYKELNIDDKFLAVRAAASAIGRLKDKMQAPAEAQAAAKDTRSQIVAQVYASYAKRCMKSGAMDFDDLIYYTVRLLQEHKEARDYYQNRYRYILVDEYQDTSVAQFLLVRLLCGPGQNICVVGDDDQSIYRFRGATIENILSFEQNFPGAEVIRLEQNYRSTSNILDAANCVIRNNQGRKGKTLWTDAGCGEKVQHYLAENENDEAAHIAAIIEQNVEAGAKLGDHAVLYRMNAQSSPVENYFTRAGIPHKIVGGLRFNDRKEIKDIHAYMSLVSSPQDDLRLRRIINEPARKIGATTVEKIAEIAAGLGLPMLEVVREAGQYPALARAQKALEGFYEVYQRLVQAEEELPLEEFAAEVPEITGYNAMLQALGEEGATRLENIGQFISNVKTYTDMNGEEASLAGYLEEIALISDLDSYDESADKAVLMTLHSAKGLEFPYVFIVGLEESIFPSEMSRWAEEDLEEERRLCYVGVTRARKALVLSSAASRLLYGQTRRNQPSRFLSEIDSDYIEQVQSPRLAAAQQSRFAAFGSLGQEGGGFGGRGRGQGRYLDSSYNRAPGNPEKARQAAESRFAGSFTSAGAQPKNSGVVYTAGDRVKHKVFGSGVVFQVTPVGGDHLVEIDFEKVGRKKTMANFAPLEKLDKGDAE